MTLRSSLLLAACMLALVAASCAHGRLDAQARVASTETVQTQEGEGNVAVTTNGAKINTLAIVGAVVLVALGFFMRHVSCKGMFHLDASKARGVE